MQPLPAFGQVGMRGMQVPQSEIHNGSDGEENGSGGVTDDQGRLSHVSGASYSCLPVRFPKGKMPERKLCQPRLS